MFEEAPANEAIPSHRRAACGASGVASIPAAPINHRMVGPLWLNHAVPGVPEVPVCALTWFGSYSVFRLQEKARRLEAARRSVGAALAALRELNPEVWVPRLQADRFGARKLMESKRTLWLSAAGELEVLRATFPDTEVARLAEKVLDRGHLVMILVSEQVSATQEPRQQWWDVIGGAHEAAVTAAKELLRAIGKELRPGLRGRGRR